MATWKRCEWQAFIYDASIKSSALKSGTLLQEISETIAKSEAGGGRRTPLSALRLPDLF